MPIITVKPNDYATIEFDDDFAAEVRLRVEAQRRVDLYVVDADGYEEFVGDRRFHYLLRSLNTRGMRKRFPGPEVYPWYILIENSHSVPVPVFYEVFYRR